MGWEGIEQLSHPFPCCLDGSFFGFSDEGLELGEHHLDRIEIRAVGRQEEEVSANISNGGPGIGCLVAAQVVEDDDIAGRQGWRQGLLDPGGEGPAVDGTIQHERSDDPVVAKPGEEGQGLPMPVGDLSQIGLATRRPSSCARHVGFHPGFIDENQALGVELMLVGLPPPPEPRHLRPILLSCHQRFF